MIEARRFLARLPPRAWAAIVLGAVVLGGGFAAAPMDPGLPSDGLFIVHVEPDSPFAPAADDPRIRSDGPPDAVVDDRIRIQDTERGRAVHSVLHARYDDHVDRRLAAEPDAAAAFPVRIDAFYVSRDLAAAAADAVDEPNAPGPSDQPADQPGGESSAGSDDGVKPDPAPTGSEPPEPARIASEQRDVRPRDLDPPFPVRSLLLTFAYVVPAGLILQLHGANLHAERTKGRARILLSTPMGPARLLAHKSAPFALLLLGLSIAVTIAIGGGLRAFLAASTVLALMLAMTTFIALWSRTPRELGMLQVGATTLLNVFLFLPAMFPSIPPVAYLSPIHVIAQDIAGAAIPWAAFAYALVPSFLATGALVAVSIAFTNEELWLGDGFRVGRAVRRASPGWKALPAGVLVVPFVFVMQLTVLVSLIVLGLDVAFWFALPASVLIEELAKALVVRGRSWRTGALAGAGFFVGEKTALLLTLVGFRDLPFGAEALALLGSGTGFLFLAAPLALHVVTGILLTRRRWGFPAALAVHFVYDRILLGWA